jgi:tRNA A37 threonylcarbamoyladenosine synthetase subunit TsaC/SUA5/YrdC
MDTQALYLVQTDTTVGFLSQDSAKLSKIKNRPLNKEYLSVHSDFKNFKAMKKRIPNVHKAYARAAQRTTFVTKNRASRIVSNTAHHDFLKPFGWFYSTSANESGKSFEDSFVRNAAEIVVEDHCGFRQSQPSTILKLSSKRKVRLR